MDTRYAFALKEIREAAKQLPAPNAAKIPYRLKVGHQDIVSKYDKSVEIYLTQRIREAFPYDGIVGEELPHEECGLWVWYIDPIDGTSNFVSQHRNYAISIGCFCDNKPMFGLVFDVAADKLFHAYVGCGAYCNSAVLPRRTSRPSLSELFLYTPLFEQTFLDEHPYRAGVLRLARDVRAVRSLGSVALEICAIAAGDAEIFLTIRSNPWDHNAARIILSETGGAVRTWDNTAVPVDRQCSVLATSDGSLMEQLMDSYFTET